MEKEQYLRELYFSPESSAAYSGIKKIWEKYKFDKKSKLSGLPKIKFQDIKNFLEKQPTYTLHKPSIKKFPFRKTMVSYVDQQWQADLVDMQKFEKSNEDYKYILTVVDIFSRYAWAKPLKRKTGVEVRDLFEDIFRQAVPEKIQFDEGKEFYNKPLKNLFDSHDVKYFSSFSDKKAAVVERFNKTLKTKMWKYFTEKETQKWIDILDELVEGYNFSKHSSIGMSPHEARKKEKADVVWYNLYGQHLDSVFGEPKFKIGDSVRIAKYKTAFAKGYLPNFTEEIFKIKQIIYTKPIVYKLEDYNGEDIQGYFYTKELSFVPNPNEIRYKIEKILKYKTQNKKKYALVKWKGWDEKFNSWEPVSEIEKLKKNL